MSTTPAGRKTLADRTAGKSGDRVGTFHLDVKSGTWCWSAEVFEMFGYPPGAVEPTPVILQRHGHPADSRSLVDVVEEAVALGESFSSQHRLVAATGGVVAIVIVGEAERDPGGSVISLHGYVVDLTTSKELEAEQVGELVDEAAGLQHALASRAPIEQAKGMIMLSYGCDAAAAFDVLIDVSQRANVKLNVLAARLVEQMQAGRAHRDIACVRLEQALLRLAGRAPG